MVGSHVIKCWSATQPGVAMSSGEAEFYGVVRAAAAGLGIKSLYGDIGIGMPVRVWTDSSAAIGVCNRQGLGKLRHLECKALWIQQRLRLGEFELRKVPGESNPADLFTKHLESKAKLDQVVSLFNCEFRDGRAASAPQLKAGLHAQAPTDEAVFIHDGNMLPHQHLPEDLEEYFPSGYTGRLGADVGEVLPKDELKDPGPRGKFEPTSTRLSTHQCPEMSFVCEDVEMLICHGEGNGKSCKEEQDGGATSSGAAKELRGRKSDAAEDAAEGGEPYANHCACPVIPENIFVGYNACRSVGALRAASSEREYLGRQAIKPNSVGLTDDDPVGHEGRNVVNPTDNDNSPGVAQVFVFHTSESVPFPRLARAPRLADLERVKEERVRSTSSARR